MGLLESRCVFDYPRNRRIPVLSRASRDTLRALPPVRCCTKEFRLSLSFSFLLRFYSRYVATENNHPVVCTSKFLYFQLQRTEGRH